MGERAWLAGLRSHRTTRAPAIRPEASGPPETGGGRSGPVGRGLRVVQPAEMLDPPERAIPPARCYSTATHLSGESAGGTIALHVRPDDRAWRLLGPGEPTPEALAALRYSHTEVPGAVGPSQTPVLTVALYPRATTLDERQRRLGLPAGPAALVQGDRISYNGLGPCTRVMRFSGGPTMASPDLSGALHLLWRAGPDVDLLLTLATSRAEQLFSVLPDVDAFADALELCAVRTRRDAASSAWTTATSPRSAFAT